MTPLLLEVLLPYPGLQLEGAAMDDGILMLSLTATASTAESPVCHEPTSRIHSQYHRRVSDLPWAGIPVELVLRVRKFFCDRVDCERRIFCERLGDGIAASYANHPTLLPAPTNWCSHSAA